MDSPENLPPQEKNTETAYPVRLRPPVFSFLAEGLRPTYEAELETARQDGSFKGLSEFHHSSRIGKLMSAMLDQFENPEVLPENPVLQLSNKDVKFLKEKIHRPQDAAGGILWKEMMKEVERSFSEARFKARVNSFIGNVKSRLKR